MVSEKLLSLGLLAGLGFIAYSGLSGATETETIQGGGGSSSFAGDLTAGNIPDLNKAPSGTKKSQKEPDIIINESPVTFPEPRYTQNKTKKQQKSGGSSGGGRSKTKLEKNIDKAVEDATEPTPFGTRVPIGDIKPSLPKTKKEQKKEEPKEDNGGGFLDNIGNIFNPIVTPPLLLFNR